ncbi:MAG: hypothetical protein GXO43_02385 [Crenarchaeota archaeon]|nr:hypothetical protein [Thermoproteota archaeon]
MKWGRSIIRSKAGKTLIVDLLVDQEGVIRKCYISGDFFAYPETIVNEIEKKLPGLRLGEALLKTRKFVGEAELLGITVEDLLDGLRKAYNDAVGQKTLDSIIH